MEMFGIHPLRDFVFHVCWFFFYIKKFCDYPFVNVKMKTKGSLAGKTLHAGYVTVVSKFLTSFMIPFRMVNI